MPADAEIIQLVQAGRGQEAFDRLVPAYRRRVFGLAYGILRDRAAAEDLAQEVFVKLWQALPRYDGRAQLSTWIYAITRNAAISALRARRRSVSLSDPAVLEEVEGVIATSAVDGRRRRLAPAHRGVAGQAAPGDHALLSGRAPGERGGRDDGPAGQHGEDAPASRPREPGCGARRRGGGARMSADDPGRTDFDARMRRLFADVDTAPGFEARVMQRVSARSQAPRTDLRAQFERARAQCHEEPRAPGLDECRDGRRRRRGRHCARLASPARQSLPGCRTTLADAAAISRVLRLALRARRRAFWPFTAESISRDRIAA